MLNLAASLAPVVMLAAAAALGAVIALMWNPEAGYSSRDTTWP